jgi:histidyl-tRNA synthetase
MSNVIRTVKGTRDYYPKDMYIRNWMYNHMRQVSESFGYEEWDGPFLESIDLYAAKSSQEIVEKQSYVFEDRGGERITLRPELTPSLARLIAKRQNQLTFPLRWWSFGPFWRYERPQKGRSREFFQWNIDMIGDDSPESDAELVAIAATFLKQVGLTPDDAKILVNNRSLMEKETKKIGIRDDLRSVTYRLIDRRDKMRLEAWSKYAKESGLDSKQISGLEDIIANKNLWEKSEQLQRLFQAVDTYGVSEFVEFEPHIIRGLDYYTGTVFEAWDTAGEFRSLFGGGRYDNLVDAVGGKPVPAVGFAVGNMVITLLLEKLGRLPETGNSPAQAFVTLFDEEHILPAIALSNQLRKAGLNVATYPKPLKLAKQFKYADRIGVRFALVLGPDELSSETVTIKDLQSGDQKSIPTSEVSKYIWQQLEGQSPS